MPDGAGRRRRGHRAYIPAKFVRLPVVGPLIRPVPAETVQLVARVHPDLIIESSPASAEAAARADWVQQQTGVPYIVLDNSIQTTPATLRSIGAMLGVGERGEDLGHYADYAIDALRGRLLIAPADERPLVYYGRGPDGLETGLAGSQATADIDAGGGHQCRRPPRPRRADEGHARPDHRLEPGNHHRRAAQLL